MSSPDDRLPTGSTIAPFRRDEEHVRLLGLYHWVLAGVNVLSLLLRVLPPLLLNPALSPLSRRSYLAALGVGSLMTAIYALNGHFLRERRHYVSCLILSCVECLSLPLGMILGVSAILVLRRDSVRALFQARRAPRL